MRISTAALPPGHATDPLQSRFGDDNSQQNAQSFADLLTIMLTDHTKSGEAEFTPAIGSHGTAFEQARMLVETAFDLAHGEGTEAFRAADILAAKVNVAHDGKAEPTATTQASFMQTFVQWLTKAAIPDKSGAVGIAPTIGAPQAAPRSPSALQATAMPADQAAPIPARMPTGPIRTGAPMATVKSSAGPEAPFRASGQQSPFGAQLSAFEGGLRLLLRLPRLTEGERHELETSLARLFESFDHRHHDIVIHEIAKGQE